MTTSTARRAFWFEWRRCETQLQLAVREAEEFGTTEGADAAYDLLCDVHDRLSWPQRVWLSVYELRRSYIRVRNQGRRNLEKES